MRNLAAVVLGLGLMFPANIGLSQTAVVPGLPALVVLDIDRLFQSSEFGRVLISQRETANRELITENQKIEAELEAEEKKLADLRPTMAASDFLVLSRSFDAKVVAIRAARDKKASDVAALVEADKNRFLEQAYPILADLMAKNGAVAVIDRRAVILGLENIDITDQAIDALNEKLTATTTP